MISVGVAQHQIANVGGIATYARNLLEGLGPAAPGTVLLRPIASADRPQSALTRLGNEQIRIPLAARDVDIIHMCDLRIPFLRRCRTIATVHDIGFITHPRFFPRPVRAYKQAQFAAMVRARPDLVACDSRYTLEQVCTAAPALTSRCSLLPPGVAEAQAKPDRAHRPAQPAYFLTVGSNEPRKNLDMLLRAYSRLRATGLALEWISIGPTDRGDPDLTRMMRHADGVSVTGYVGPAELERLWGAAAFLAMPSHLEGFSYPVIEAMQRGVPVIASQGSALDETAGDAAIRLDPLDETGWTDAMITLTTDLAARAQGRGRGLRQAEQFGWDRRSEAFIDAYMDLAA